MVTSPGTLDEIPKPMVVALLKASHADYFRMARSGAQLIEAMRDVPRPEMVRRDDNSRWKIQNVRGDSSAKKGGKISITPHAHFRRDTAGNSAGYIRQVDDTQSGPLWARR